MFKVVTDTEILYINAKNAKTAQKIAEEQGHVVRMVVKQKGCQE